MKILNKELPDLDFMDVEVIEKFEELQEEHTYKINNTPKFDKTSEMVRYHCELVFDLFNGLFGNGTDREIFGNKTNILTCTKAMDELFNYIEEVNKVYNKEFNAINNHLNRRRQ